MKGGGAARPRRPLRPPERPRAPCFFPTWGSPRPARIRANLRESAYVIVTRGATEARQGEEDEEEEEEEAEEAEEAEDAEEADDDSVIITPESLALEP